MRKTIITILCFALFASLLIFTGCNKDDVSITETPTPKETEKSTPKATKVPDATATPVKSKTDIWLENIKDGDKVIYTYDQIKQYNTKLISKSNALIDIFEAPLTYDKNTIANYINAGYIPNLPKYNSGVELTTADLNEIKDNRNISAIPNQVTAKYGIAVYRVNLRSLPTSKAFFDSASDTYYDRIQETEIYMGMPVLVLHTSKDNEFVYIQTYFYRGWVKADSIAICDTKEEWLSFGKPDSFVAVIEPLLTLGNAKADMGTIFPLVNESENEYTIKIPIRNNDGKISGKEVKVNKKDTSKGYLPFTKGNYISQAFKYLGTEYGWGGSNDGVDCSGFLVNLFRSFGFMFPRNTGQQSGVIGDKVIKLEGKDS